MYILIDNCSNGSDLPVVLHTGDYKFKMIDNVDVLADRAPNGYYLCDIEEHGTMTVETVIFKCQETTPRGNKIN